MDGIFAIEFEETNNQLIYIIAVSFIGGENWSYRTLTNFITWKILEVIFTNFVFDIAYINVNSFNIQSQQ